jgi:hypothetical protein
MTQFKAGQKWKYKTRAIETDSVLLILQVNEADDHETISPQGDPLPTVPSVNCAVNGLSIPNLPEFFFPISEEALRKSVTSLIKLDLEDPEFIDTYVRWKDDPIHMNPSYFTISVAEVVALAEQGAANRR